ncbi:MAG TPA: hypothetical protein DCE42_07320 [Myxococcales bacterium]|nr:hypothetical protein [Myxococcales bacterium]
MFFIVQIATYHKWFTQKGQIQFFTSDKNPKRKARVYLHREVPSVIRMHSFRGASVPHCEAYQLTLSIDRKERNL